MKKIYVMVEMVEAPEGTLIKFTRAYCDIIAAKNALLKRYKSELPSAGDEDMICGNWIDPNGMEAYIAWDDGCVIRLSVKPTKLIPSK